MKFTNLILAMISATAVSAYCPESASDRGERIEALDTSVWDSSIWISAADAEVVKGEIDDSNWNAADGASCFLFNLKNEGKVESARWMTTGLGVYDIYVNAELIGEEFLKPGFTHYAKTKYSFTYDVTDVMNTDQGAENTFYAQVTPGWWADKIITPIGNNGMNGKKCAFRAVLQVRYSDGTVKNYGTDTDNWKAGIAGPVKHAAIFDGEYYDARELPGYETPDKLSRPERNTEFNGEILPSEGAEIYLRKDLELTPVRSYIWDKVEGANEDEYGKIVISKEFAPGENIRLMPGETLIVDFGQNAAAVPSFVFKAEEGTVLTCLPSEILNDGNGSKSRGMDGPEGSCHRLNLRTADRGMIMEYTFGDASNFVEHSPRHTFFGYRYVSVTATNEVVIKSITSIPVTSITENLQTGRISTGNDLVNKLISNTIWGMYSNYLSVPTDCPQRDERLGWTADTQVFAETGTFFANTASFMQKWMRDMRDTQSELGGFPGVAPFGQYCSDERSMMRLGWADAGVIVPWTIWKQLGDESIIEENWDSMELFMDHINNTKYDHNTLKEENDNYQWADWLSYEPLESCGEGAFANDENGVWGPIPDAVEYWNYLSASYWAIDAGMMRDMAEVSGRDYKKYEEMENNAKDYLRTRFFTPDGLFKTEILNTMQTPALFALKNRLFEGEARENMIARLRDNFRKHDNCLQTGFLGTSILMTTLTENGMVDIAYELLFQRKNPSWLYSIDNGATTIWERWNSYMIEHGMGPRGMNSFNHYAYGCVCEWIWETAAGIASDPAEPGFKHIIMKPVPDKRLGHLEAEYNSVAGLIRSKWRYEGDKCIWEFTVPEGSRATVTLPGQTESKEYPSGAYKLEIF